MFNPDAETYTYNGKWFWDEVILGKKVQFQQREDVSWCIETGSWGNRVPTHARVAGFWKKRDETKEEQMKRICEAVWASVRKYTPPEPVEFIGKIGNPPETQP